MLQMRGGMVYVDIAWGYLYIPHQLHLNNIYEDREHLFLDPFMKRVDLEVLSLRLHPLIRIVVQTLCRIVEQGEYTWTPREAEVLDSEQAAGTIPSIGFGQVP
jgi:hypothetical protein